MERTQSFIAISNSGHFGPCSTGTGLFQDDGAFASVGIWKESNSNQRIEIGIVSCADASYGFCRGKGNYNYFASYGDDSNVRHYVNLGSAGNAEGVWNHFKIAKVDATTWKGYVNTTQISYTFPYSSIDGWVNGGTTSFWTNDWEDGGDSIGHNSSTGARTRFLTMRMRTEGGVDISPFDADGRNFTDPCTLSQNGGGGYQVDSGQNNHWCDIIAYDEFHSWSTG